MKNDSIKNLKSGFVAIVGRPSVGKSELLNALVGFKTSIVSPLPQTTRQAVRGILTTNDGQIIFLDSPGMHLSDKKFNRHMLKQTEFVVKEADVVLYLLDITRSPKEEERLVAELLQKSSKPIIIGLNKIDLPQKKHASHELGLFTKHFFKSSPRLELSALKKEGLEELKRVLINSLPTGELLYDSDIYTDQSPAFRIAEVIRESAIPYLHQELPHSLYVEIADLEMKGKDLWARCFLTVEREQQKGIVIGKGGTTLSLIRNKAQKSLKKIFPYHVKMELSVKVDKEWRKNDTRLYTMFKV